MNSLSDTLTIGLVLILLFGSVALYLYTRIQQSEQKINLLEGILLDIKMSSEIKDYTELPVETLSPPKNPTEDTYVPYEELEMVVEEKEVENTLPIEDASLDYKSVIQDAIQETPLLEESSPSYESMTVKELQALAKERGIAGLTKKSALVDALRSKTVQPGLLGSGSFLETSADVSSDI
jgi:hypothetical protein